MSDILLGIAARTNYGLRMDFSSDLNPVYQGYINTLSQAMISAVYGGEFDACIITQNMPVVFPNGPVDIITNSNFSELESALISFCKKHDVFLTIQRNVTDLNATVDLLNVFSIEYI